MKCPGDFNRLPNVWPEFRDPCPSGMPSVCLGVFKYVLIVLFRVFPCVHVYLSILILIRYNCLSYLPNVLVFVFREVNIRVLFALKRDYPVLFDPANLHRLPL